MVDREQQAARLIASYPLGWLVSRDFNASPLPLLAEQGEDGRIISLFGHCARRNPLCDDFRKDSSGLVLFQGPAGYISPRHVSNRDWAPTWNYAVLRFTVRVEMLPSEASSAVERLLNRLEADYPGHWSTAELGERYVQMLDQIVAFRAHVESFAPTFKLGQDETDQTFAEIVDRHPDAILADWMRYFREQGG